MVAFSFPAGLTHFGVVGRFPFPLALILVWWGISLPSCLGFGVVGNFPLPSDLVGFGVAGGSRNEYEY